MPTLGATYGSVGAVVVLLIWLSWNINAVFYGGAFATEMETIWRARRIAPDSAESVGGEANASAADVVSLQARRASRRGS
jgi:membrane protein